MRISIWKAEWPQYENALLSHPANSFIHSFSAIREYSPLSLQFSLENFHIFFCFELVFPHTHIHSKQIHKIISNSYKTMTQWNECNSDSEVKCQKWSTFPFSLLSAINNLLASAYTTHGTAQFFCFRVQFLELGNFPLSMKLSQALIYNKVFFPFPPRDINIHHFSPVMDFPLHEKKSLWKSKRNFLQKWEMEFHKSILESHASPFLREKFLFWNFPSNFGNSFIFCCCILLITGK